jgi:hypothetical protein
LNKEEFEIFLDFISEWFSYGMNLEKLIKKPKYRNVWNKLVNHTKRSKLPRYLYRGVSFYTKKERDEYLKKFKSKREFESWTSSKSIAKQFSPLGAYGAGRKYGLILRIETKDFKDNIVFSINALIPSDKDKKEFFEKLVENHYQDLKKALAQNNIKRFLTKKNTDLTKNIDGGIYSLIEDEYILKTISDPNQRKKIYIETVERNEK